MNYTKKLKQFYSAKQTYAGVRSALAIVVPSIIFGYFGIFEMMFLFPLGTSFAGFVDNPGPFIRRRNTLIGSIISFFVVAIIASLLKDFPILGFLEIIIFSMFFNMIGIYGARLTSLGGLSLIVLAIFIDGHITSGHIVISVLSFVAGSIWYFLLLLVLSKLQPYKLARQMVGENYIELSQFLKVRSGFYKENTDISQVVKDLLGRQILIKNKQEETRELVFKTRKFVNESTTTSRLLMLLFINSIDLYERLFTSESDYKKLHQAFEGEEIFSKLERLLVILSEELENIGIAIQSGTKPKILHDIDAVYSDCFSTYFELRQRRLSSGNVEDFMILRQILMRIAEVGEDIKTIYTTATQDPKLAKSLSSGLDLEKFLPKEQPLNIKIFKNNFSLKSTHFRHAVRVTLAMLIGYAIALAFPDLGHSYWILITIIAIMRPAYSITKNRNILRLYGTSAGAALGFLIIYFVHIPWVLLLLLFLSMTICFMLIKTQYFWGVLFLTVYVFLTFNFLKPGGEMQLLEYRIFDTFIGGIVAFAVSYFVLPVWEHTQNKQFMKQTIRDNHKYFEEVMDIFLHQASDDERYRLLRKNAIISLANFSDNFQRMLSDPKAQQKRMEHIHQFVTTAHLSTAYIASLSRFAKSKELFPEVDFQTWKTKISSEFRKIETILNDDYYDQELNDKSDMTPEDYVDELLKKRKTEIANDGLVANTELDNVTHLTQLKSIRELLELIFSVVKDQRKIALKLRNQAVTTDKI
ncbi:FUSC family protein [Riemerella columbipharyngis]|uniref:Uncharacterized membrane protein YccC n=1 Tax=Riemerella columbipharyngis TaxID=1071918 RepID=A0A1G6ZM81_9FLAO|nr:FUSC family membrane protein [Riemerella columbipharyngis]SDE03709.1 Uncharacterized membrane protein YccC [Riemerella columbipharyngis]